MAMISLRGQNLLLLPSKKRVKSDESQHLKQKGWLFVIVAGFGSLAVFTDAIGIN